MQMEQKAAHAPKVDALWSALVALRGPCLGCPGCTGICAALIETITLPEAVSRARS